MNLYTKMAMGLMAGTGAAAYPSDADAMYVGPKAAGWEGLMGKFSSLMDRMPRAEISDAGARSLIDEMVPQMGTVDKLPNFLRHDDLYRQYPFLRDINVSFADRGEKGAAYFPQNNLISVDRELAGESKSPLLHEIQHAIQEKEGWAKGGSPETYAGDPEKGDWLVNAERLDNLKAWITEVGGELNRGKKKIYYTDPYTMQDVTLSPKEASDLIGKMKREQEFIQSRLNYKNPEQVYRSLSGEIESRDTAARMGLTSVQRQATAPYSGQGIPLKDTITKMGVAAPVGAILAEQAAERRRMAQAEALQDAFNPVEYLSPARWGGGLINMGIDALLSTVGN